MRLRRSGDEFSKAMLPAIAVSLALAVATSAAPPKLDERPADPGQWGYRPADGSVSETDPPSFTWRPQEGLTWELQCAKDAQFANPTYQAQDVELSVHCPPKTFGPGRYHWRYRGKDKQGRHTKWSKPRAFTIAADAAQMPMPGRDALLALIPETHPRLFLRPENLDRLRASARGEMKREYQDLARQCDRLLANPPSTEEPPKYPPDMKRLSEAWREMWWGNRTYTIRALNGAATLGFTWLLGGQDRYGREAKRILLECAKWNPKGSTGYRYNDEAGMPYNYYFSRTYSFVNWLLSDQEKAACRRVMKVRGDEMYRHLCPRHLWQPYSSHSNRAWHFLGEVGIAFLGEVEGADDWVWFAANVFFNTYPVWSDADGGWHEGSSYWSSYIGRFTWWADVMREAMGIDAYDKPYFSKIGYYAMYLLPPGKVGGGLGDLTARRTAQHNRQLMTVLAAQAQNPHWQWYVEQVGGPDSVGGYIGFIRGQLPKVQAQPPDDLPVSRLFAGTGQAYLNSSIKDASESVQVVFKSSPFGTQSHGYEANNSFLLWAYGKRLLIRSGYRDIYGSAHHQKWMWSTRSVNNITVNGQSQGHRTARSRGKITAFETTPAIDVVVGDATDSYERGVELFKRAVIFVKPDLVIVYDRLRASEPSTFEYWLHAINKFDVDNQRQIQVKNDDVVCDIDFLAPTGLSFEQTDQYDPNPRPRITLREWHLTAKTAEKAKNMEFMTLLRPYKTGGSMIGGGTLREISGGYLLQLKHDGADLVALLPTDDTTAMEAAGLRTTGAVKLRLSRPGQSAQIVEVHEQG